MARLDYTTSILGVIVIIFLFVAYWIFLKKAAKDQNIEGVVEQRVSAPSLSPLLKDNMKVTKIKDVQPFLQDMQQRQEGLRLDVEKVVASISKLEQSLGPVTEIAQQLDRMFFGSPQIKGALGERIIEERLALLPLDWITRDVKFSNGRKVEFALRTPNGLLIPIDSKWAATELLDRLNQTTDKDERAALIKQIRDVVSERAYEVYRYLDDHRTIGFGIAVVPDAVLPYCLDAQARLLKANVVLISHSLLVPYILIIFNLFLSSAQGIQALQISQILKRSLMQIEQIQEEIDTNIRPSLDTVKLQQSQYIEHDQQLQKSIARLSQIQIALEAVRNSLPPPVGAILNRDVDSIASDLKFRLNLVREGLTEGIASQLGRDVNKSSQ